jgi:hypothetical protein
MDPNISKETTDKERVVTECAESQTYGTINRWSDFHVPIHSPAFAMDTQFCRREIDEGGLEGAFRKARFQADRGKEHGDGRGPSHLVQTLTDLSKT